METDRPSQLPSGLLITVMVVLGICALPTALFFLLSGLSGPSGPSLFLVLGLGVPAFIGYPVALWLWFRARRVRTSGRAWLIAVLGLLLVVGSSTAPVVLIGGAVAEEWGETQPGGRGH